MIKPVGNGYVNLVDLRTNKIVLRSVTRLIARLHAKRLRELQVPEEDGRRRYSTRKGVHSRP